MSMDHVFPAGSDGDGDDVAGDFCRESDGPGRAAGGVFRHEKGAAAGDALECAKDAAPAAVLGGGVHVYRSGHPGELAGDGDDAFVGVEMNLEHRHRGTYDLVLHERLVAAGNHGVKRGRGIAPFGRA